MKVKITHNNSTQIKTYHYPLQQIEHIIALDTFHKELKAIQNSGNSDIHIRHQNIVNWYNNEDAKTFLKHFNIEVTPYV